MPRLHKQRIFRVWKLLDDGLSPYRIEQEEITSEQTAERLRKVMQGFKGKLSDEEIVNMSSLLNKIFVLRMRELWNDYESTSSHQYYRYQ